MAKPAPAGTGARARRGCHGSSRWSQEAPGGQRFRVQARRCLRAHWQALTPSQPRTLMTASSRTSASASRVALSSDRSACPPFKRPPEQHQDPRPEQPQQALRDCRRQRRVTPPARASPPPNPSRRGQPSASRQARTTPASSRASGGRSRLAGLSTGASGRAQTRRELRRTPRRSRGCRPSSRRRAARATRSSSQRTVGSTRPEATAAASSASTQAQRSRRRATRAGRGAAASWRSCAPAARGRRGRRPRTSTAAQLSAPSSASCPSQCTRRARSR